MYSYDTNWIYNIVLFKEKNMKAYVDLLKYILENGSSIGQRFIRDVDE